MPYQIRRTPIAAVPAEVWADLASGSMPTVQKCWALALSQTLNRNDDSIALVAAEDGRPKAVLAGFTTRRRPAVLRLLGDGLWEPLGVASSHPSALVAVMRHLAERGQPIAFARVPSDSALVSAVRDAYRGRGIIVERPWTDEGCPFIALDPSWEAPESHFNSGRRSDFRRMRRNAEAIGPIRVEILSPTAADAPSIVDTAFQVEAASWKGESGSAVLHHPERLAFFHAFAKNAAASGLLRIAFLHIGDSIAAMQYAIECGGGFWLFKIGYDRRFERASPGALLMLETLAHAARSGLATYEFLGVEAGWTRAWTTTVRPMTSLRAFPINASGARAYLDFLSDDRLRPLLRRLQRSRDVGPASTAQR